MNRPPDPIESPDAHLSLEDLAVLAEGRAAPPDALRHLSRCRSCMAAYADAVRYHAAWLAHPEAFRSTTPGESAPRPPDRARSTIEIGTWAAAAASIAIVVALFTLGPWRATSSGRGMPPAVQRLLVQASSEGLVFPGAEVGAAGDGPSYRTAPGVTEEVESTLERLRERIESGERSVDAVYALAAGLIAAGRTDLAHDYLGEARLRAPKDARFLVLAAMVALRRGEPAEAESLLQRARLLAPRDPTVALDLGIVVHQTRGLNEARPYLIEAIERAPRSPLSQRARRLLEDGESP